MDSEETPIMAEEEVDDGMMGFPTLENFLVTEDGDNIADGIVKALSRISDRIDTQNKILIKILSSLTKA
jgi:hypothetical protein